MKESDGRRELKCSLDILANAFYWNILKLLCPKLSNKRIGVGGTGICMR